MKKIFKNKIIQFILVFLLIIFIFSSIFPEAKLANFFRSSFSYISNPISDFFYSSSLSAKRSLSSVVSFSSVRKENEKLKSELLELESELVELLEFKEENETLREQLGLKKKDQDFDLIKSSVIGLSPNNFKKIITIDKGSKDGVKNNNPVILEQFLIGKIVKVYKNSSQVQLVASVDSVVNGLVQESRSKGVIKGQVGYGLEMESIHQKAEISEGQAVITSGLGGGFPKGLIIGYVDQILSSEGDIFVSASLANPINYNDLETVFVIKQ
jgi:rod shape-determining protein MreC